MTLESNATFTKQLRPAGGYRSASAAVGATTA
jgi:hypothetical protein